MRRQLARLCLCMYVAHLFVYVCMRTREWEAMLYSVTCMWTREWEAMLYVTKLCCHQAMLYVTKLCCNQAMLSPSYVVTIHICGHANGKLCCNEWEAIL